MFVLPSTIFADLLTHHKDCVSWLLHWSAPIHVSRAILPLQRKMKKGKLCCVSLTCSTNAYDDFSQIFNVAQPEWLAYFLLILNLIVWALFGVFTPSNRTSTASALPSTSPWLAHNAKDLWLRPFLDAGSNANRHSLPNPEGLGRRWVSCNARSEGINLMMDCLQSWRSFSQAAAYMSLLRWTLVNVVNYYVSISIFVLQNMSFSWEFLWSGPQPQRKKCTRAFCIFQGSQASTEDSICQFLQQIVQQGERYDREDSPLGSWRNASEERG